MIDIILSKTSFLHSFLFQKSLSINQNGIIIPNGIIIQNGKCNLTIEVNLNRWILVAQYVLPNQYCVSVSTEYKSVSTGKIIT